jgi:hypothetical protein
MEQSSAQRAGRCSISYRGIYVWQELEALRLRSGSSARESHGLRSADFDGVHRVMNSLAFVKPFMLGYRRPTPRGWSMPTNRPLYLSTVGRHIIDEALRNWFTDRAEKERIYELIADDTASRVPVEFLDSDITFLIKVLKAAPEFKLQGFRTMRRHLLRGFTMWQDGRYTKVTLDCGEAKLESRRLVLSEPVSDKSMANITACLEAFAERHFPAFSCPLTIRGMTIPLAFQAGRYNELLVDLYDELHKVEGMPKDFVIEG